ncbi:MAG: 6-bladed beta-propeller [Bacteroidales bacterium]|jgi:hypothetical protein|nr:6-bladed beta-propeller [Bacteroidales bacterium]
MKKIFILIYLLSIFTGCSDEIKTEKYPIIDLVGSVEKYQRVFCSDYFSSIDLIPLETNEECLLRIGPSPKIILKDSFIFMSGDCLYAFDRSGKFLNQIGRKGQGPGEYLYSSSFFLNTDKSVLYVEDLYKILEYDSNGNHIRTMHTPKLNDKGLINLSYVGDDLFIGSMFNDGKNKYKYCLFDKNGEISECFPNYVFFNREKERASTYDRALDPIHVDNQLYLKDYINDTLYSLEKSKLQPAYIFELGKYSYPIEYLETFNIENPHPLNSFIFGTGLGIVGTPKFFFYNIRVPDLFSKPKAKPRYSPLLNKLIPNESYVYGIYNIEQKTNILLDTDEHFQKGFVNDLNGGLPFIPKYYAGNNIVVDVWFPEDMKEMLSEEYFASQTIKDQQVYQKLKELLKDLKEDDNPVVVVAKLK